ncbi:BZ3500_MvSof-1268-A1-R1_Chr12-3g04058 [Microbotryum saponariae]|uniref:BZ3500_MvSof-1268-A1-R1_Chr12-3g04058 protein n=1 Tax=Microbotryum saponariae TaxID=289078 RepID=A0A2X0KSQ8_9BASI|nr:BZ3500_MvSof-1268-A1-R1_Chr12-3g04058 [Microbotryum saponariae]SDA02616.1 BZ3501_MvSof-1269-A2-R1_Chr12-3g03713 [Microbotryum saponariae]
MLTSSVAAPTDSTPKSAPKAPSLTRFPSSWIPLSTSHPLGSSTLSHHLEPTQRVFLDPQKKVKYLWKSRGHRKGCAVEVQSDDAHLKAEAAEPEKEGVWKEDRVNGLRWWGWDYWDISWWVASESYMSLDCSYKWAQKLICPSAVPGTP